MTEPAADVCKRFTRTYMICDEARAGGFMVELKTAKGLLYFRVQQAGELWTVRPLTIKGIKRKPLGKNPFVRVTSALAAIADLR